MTTQIEAMKLALEALQENHHLIEEHERPEYLAQYDRVISVVTKALADQPARQEPVAWAKDTGKKLRITHMDMGGEEGWRPLVYCDPSPQPAQPQPQPQPQQEQEQEQEPVAWMTHEVSTGTQVWLYEKTAKRYQNPPTPLYTSPQPAPVQQEPVGYEKYAAIREGHRNACEEAYFGARPDLPLATSTLRVFRHGFDRGYDLAAAAPQPAQQEMPDDWFKGMPEEYRREAWRIKEQP